MIVDHEKTAFNRQAKATLRAHLRSKTWEQKVKSIVRMNKAGKLARAAVQKATEKRQ